jgi:calcineurin-like phosphoesterase family protein
MNYFIADLHFGHANCLAYDNRPFSTVEEQDEFIIKAWNDVVSAGDDVYILGDISWYDSTKTIEIFKQLKGNKHLIKGNHDGKLLKNKEVRELFVEIKDYKEVSAEDGKSIVLCHYPIPCFKNHYYGWYHLYGHVHNSFEWNMMETVKRQMTALYDKQCKMFNVGAMIHYMNYVPKTLEQIISAEAGDDSDT